MFIQSTTFTYHTDTWFITAIYNLYQQKLSNDWHLIWPISHAHCGQIYQLLFTAVNQQCHVSTSRHSQNLWILLTIQCWVTVITTLKCTLLHHWPLSASVQSRSASSCSSSAAVIKSLTIARPGSRKPLPAYGNVGSFGPVNKHFKLSAILHKLLISTCHQ